MTRTSALWIFGYGSLVWRPAFEHTATETGYVVGWTRRFWQGSTDHRGVPGAPGRVATVVREEGARCWGTAYRVRSGHEDAVMRRLDHREQGGYARAGVVVALPTAPKPSVDALMYVATPSNENWLGDASVDAIAAQIRTSFGPSGPNTEYLLRLHEALVAMGAVDPHVAALAARVRDDL